MKRPQPNFHRAIALMLAGLLSPGCAGPGALMSVTPKAGASRAGTEPGRTADAQLRPLPAANAQAFVATAAGGNLAGTARLTAIDEAYFANSAAPYRVAALPLPLGNAMVTLSTLQDELYTKDGDVIDGLTGLDGAFTLSGLAPKDRPYVVNVNFVQSHRLSALVVPDAAGEAGAVKVDEASSMIVETARWQLREVAGAHAPQLASLYTSTAALLSQVGLATDGGAIPHVEALKLGAGHALRNAYVATFGSLIGEAATGDANANALSDGWKALLGFRPLALTRVAGNGNRGHNQGDGRSAVEVPLGGAYDVASDHLGNLYLTEQDAMLVRFVPKGGHGPLLAQAGAMEGGKLYTIAGQLNAATDLYAFNDMYAGWEDPDTGELTGPESASVANPAAAPLVKVGYPILGPRRVLVQRRGATADSHLFVLSKFAHRVFMIPGGFEGGDAADPAASPAADATAMFGRTLYAGRLYTVIGNGELGDPASAQADDTPAHAFKLNEPTAFAQDSLGNLYVLDGLAGAVRMVRAGGAKAGTVITLPLKEGAGAFKAVGAQDLQVVESAEGNFLYLADTEGHRVVRFALPADLTALNAAAPADMAMQAVLGVKNEPGYLRAGLTYPDVHDLSKALSEADARLNTPTSLTFDGAGHLIVAARGRLHLLEKAALAPTVSGNTYVIAGGLDTRYIVGDSRLGYFPGTTAVRYEPASRNLLLVDNRENLVRRIWTVRGTL